MDRLEQVFSTVTYYGVLLLIAAYILEKGSEKGFIAKPSRIYSQIDMIASKDRDEALASFGGDTEKAIKSLEMSIRTLEKMDDKNELSKAHNNLGVLLDNMGRKEDAEAEYREALRINPNGAEAHNNLGLLLYAMGRKEDAEAVQRSYLLVLWVEVPPLQFSVGNVVIPDSGWSDPMAESSEVKAFYREASNQKGRSESERNRRRNTRYC